MKRFALAAIACAVWAGAAQAQSPDNTIAYRKQVMGVIGNHMKSIGNLVKGEVGYGDHLAVHAAGLAAAAKIALDPFEAKVASGSKEKTTATPKIWEDWETFSDNMQTMQQRAAALSEVAASGDKGRIGKAIKELGGACKECHDAFRDK